MRKGKNLSAQVVRDKKGKSRTALEQERKEKKKNANSTHPYTHTKGKKKYTNCICTLNHKQNIFSKQGIPLCYI